MGSDRARKILTRHHSGALGLPSGTLAACIIVRDLCWRGRSDAVASSGGQATPDLSHTFAFL